MAFYIFYIIREEKQNEAYCHVNLFECKCLKAFYDRTGSFAIYQTEALYLDAFMKCNGCGNPPNTDHGMLEKIERLKQLGTQIVHVGICARKKDGTECPSMTEIIRMLEQNGMKIVKGTH